MPLTHAASVQIIQVTLNGVYDSTNFAIPIGDTNGNGTVNASDLSQTKSRVGHAVNGTTFRSDVNANGYIDVVDVSIAKSSVGTGPAVASLGFYQGTTIFKTADSPASLARRSLGKGGNALTL